MVLESCCAAKIHDVHCVLQSELKTGYTIDSVLSYFVTDHSIHCLNFLIHIDLDMDAPISVEDRSVHP